MSVLRGAAVGALSLTMLDVLVGTDQAAGRAGGLFTGVANLSRAFMSADVPAIRDRSGCLDNGLAERQAAAGAATRKFVEKKLGGNPVGDAVNSGLRSVLNVMIP